MNSTKFYDCLRLATACLFILLLLSNQQILAFQSKARQRSATNFIQASQKAQKWAEKTLRKMSVEEKVGQLVSVGINARFWNQDSEGYQDLKRQVVENKVGGIILFGSPVYEAVHITNRMQNLAKLPLLISADLEAGVGMRFEDTVNFPWNMAVAATGEPALARRQGEITAREARALGVHHVFAPVVDVNNNAGNPVINVRSYGENPETVARFANAFIEGLQANGAIATVKHFPGHGDTSVDSHRGLPIINLPRARFDQIELMPFRSAVNNGVGSVMVAHISLPQIDPTEIKPLEKAIRPAYVDEGGEIVVEKATMPASLSPVVNTQILRREMNFNGLIVTDAMDMSGLTLYFNQDEAAVRAILAGADIILKPADADAAIRGLREAVKSGRISEDRLNESVKRLLIAKYELGLVEKRLVAVDEIDKSVAGKETRELAEEIAAKAITLVRNEEQTLPLKKSQSKSSVFVLAVTNGDDRYFVANTFLRTLRQNGINFDAAVLDERSSEAELKNALAKAGKAELVIAPLYGRVRTGSARSVGLPESSEKLLRQLLDENKKVVGISFGNPYLLQEFPKMKTYLVAYGDMASLQRAAARSILGQQEIQGRLPINLPGLVPIGTGLNYNKQQ